MFRKTVSGLMLLLLVISSLIAAFRIQPASAADVDEWPMFHHDLTHTGYSTSTAPRTNQTLWNYTTGFGVYSSPAVAGGVVYVGSYDSGVYALNASTGALVWNYFTRSSVFSSPAVAGGVVYVGSDDNKVYALNASTGALVWNYTTGNYVESSPAVAGGVVYVGSADGRVYALNASTGALVWNYTRGPAGDWEWSSPAIADGVVYVGSSDNNIYALNASTGALVWRHATGNYVVSSPVVVGGVVYVGSVDGRVYALNASTGALVWNYTTGGAVESSPAVAGGVVYVGSDDNKVYALNASTGALVWNYTTGNYVLSSPAVAGGMVYVGSWNNNIYALNASTGALVWNYATGSTGNEWSSPAVAGGVVYVGSADGRVDAFSSSGGPTALSVTCSTNPVYAGSPVACTATVSGSNPTGTVTWSSNSSTGSFSQSVCTLSNGNCSTTYTDTSAGTMIITASYSGDSNNAPGSSSTVLTVLTQPGPFELNVSVVDSGGLPVSNASVEAANIAVYSDASGIASFNLLLGSYNVTASHSDYQPAFWTVVLNQDKNITLTLAYNYTFEGEIPDSDITLTPVEKGYNITLLNSLTSSPMDVFIEWNYLGTIPAGTLQTFSYNHLPNLIVEAAIKGSSDYPNAWYKHPLPIPLVPSTGQGAFLQEPVPFAAGSIFVTPYPPVIGKNTTIGVTLHDTFDYTLNISRIDFQISSLNIGGDLWTSVGYLSNVTLQSNETNRFSIIWLATVSGHHCVRVVLTYSPESQTLQRNMDIENDVLLGQTGEASFILENPYQMTKEIMLNVNMQVPPSWQVKLEIDGMQYDPSKIPPLQVAAGARLAVTLQVLTDKSEASIGIIDVEGYIDGKLIGGIRKTLATKPESSTDKVLEFLVNYQGSYYDVLLWAPLPNYENMVQTDQWIFSSFPNVDKNTLEQAYYASNYISDTTKYPITKVQIHAPGSAQPLADAKMKTGILKGLLKYCYELFLLGTPIMRESYDTLGQEWHKAYQDSAWKVTASDWITNIAYWATLFGPLFDFVKAKFGQDTGDQLKGSVELLFGILSDYESLKEKYGSDKADSISSILMKYGLVTSKNYDGTEVYEAAKADPSKLSQAITEIESKVMGVQLTSDANTLITKFVQNLYSETLTDIAVSGFVTLYAYYFADLSVEWSVGAGVHEFFAGFVGDVLPLSLADALGQAYVYPMAEAIHASWEDMEYEAKDYFKMNAVATEIANLNGNVFDVKVANALAGLYGIRYLIEYHYYMTVYYYRSRQWNVPQTELDSYKSYAQSALSGAQDWKTMLDKINTVTAALVASNDPSGSTFSFQLNPPLILPPVVPANSSGFVLIANSTSNINLTCGNCAFIVQNRTWSSNFTYPLYVDDAYGTYYLIIFNPPEGTYNVISQQETLMRVMFFSQSGGNINVTGETNVTASSMQFNIGAHDVAVTNVTADRMWVYQGFSANVNVTVLNKGNFDENVAVTLYYNVTANKIIGTQNATLSAGQNETFAFVWDTTGVPYCHNYTLTAVASIPLDSNPADNTLGGGPVNVRILGDMNGDGTVDIYDAIMFANYFGLQKGEARWNPDADMNRDGITDIFDAIIIVKHFGISGSS